MCQEDGEVGGGGEEAQEKITEPEEFKGMNSILALCEPGY